MLNEKYRESDADAMEELFVRVLNVSREVFGKFAFRRMPDRQKRRPISKALFETWTSLLARRTNDEMDTLMKRKEILLKKYVDMCSEDGEFIDSIGSGKVSSARKRFERIDGLIKEVLNNA